LARIRVVFAEKRDAVRVRDGLLSGDEIAAVLNDLGLNRAQAAAVFGGGPNAFAKYINGEVLQSFAMDRLLRLTHRAGAAAVSFLRDVKSTQHVPFVSAEVTSYATFGVAAEAGDAVVSGNVAFVEFGRKSA